VLSPTLYIQRSTSVVVPFSAFKSVMFFHGLTSIIDI